MTKTLGLVDELAPQEPGQDSVLHAASGEAFGAVPGVQEPPPEVSDTAAADAALIRQLVAQAREAGMDITGRTDC